MANRADFLTDNRTYFIANRAAFMRAIRGPTERELASFLGTSASDASLSLSAASPPSRSTLPWRSSRSSACWHYRSSRGLVSLTGLAWIFELLASWPFAMLLAVFELLLALVGAFCLAPRAGALNAVAAPLWCWERRFVLSRVRLDSSFIVDLSSSDLAEMPMCHVRRWETN